MKVGGTFGFFNIEEANLMGMAGEIQAAQVLYDQGESVKYPFMHTELTFWKQCGLDVYIHGPMNINPCDPVRRGWTNLIMKDCCKFAGRIDAKGIVVHPGSKKEHTEQEALDCLYKFCFKMLDWTPCPILLEVDAGSKNGNRMGSPEHLLEICDQINDPRVKICIDTTHLYARGVDVWDDETRAQLIFLLKPHLRLIHLNVPDPVCTLGSFRDRHNTTFAEFEKPSHAMIWDFVSRYPVILERHDLEKQRVDANLIKHLWEEHLDVLR